jgi:excisionase family DNA binding protein
MNLLTVSQAAALLGVSARRVRAMIGAGTIKATKVNDRLYLVAKSALKGIKIHGKAGRPKAD